MVVKVPIVHIILVNYNSSKDTICCIESIKKSNKEFFKCNIIIVDNNSNDSEQIILEHFIKSFNEELITLNLIKNPENVGFAAANNIGLDYIEKLCSSSDYIWFLNNDTQVNTELLCSIKNSLPEKHEVLYFEMRNFDYEFVNDGLNYISLSTGKYYEVKKKNTEPYIVGASVFLRYCENFPRWDDSYFLYFEDVAYSFLLKSRNYKFIKLPDVYYLHKINASSGKNSKTLLIRIQSQKKFMKEYSPHYFLFVIMKVFYLIIQLRFKEVKSFITFKP